MKTLYLIEGIPGSGKSYWCNKQLHAHGPETALWVSRDKIRCSLLEDGDDYFAVEDQAFSLFLRAVNSAIASPSIQYIYADATHLTDKARSRTLRGLDLEDVEVINVFFDVPLVICKARNNLRTGRARVPETAINRMARSFRYPNNGYKTIIINEKGEIKNE